MLRAEKERRMVLMSQGYIFMNQWHMIQNAIHGTQHGWSSARRPVFGNFIARGVWRNCTAAVNEQE